MIDWGTYQGKRRNPCPEDPVLLKGAPIGMYHCPYCGCMQLAGIAHLPPEEDYEVAYGEEWPAGYEDP
jgi:hypothetical protein